MKVTSKSNTNLEFGDFQTPDSLAIQIVNLVQQQGIKPRSIIEPTCGKGSFVIACLKTFTNAKYIIANDINTNYLNFLKKRISILDFNKKVELCNEDFFILDWKTQLERLSEPILIIGNPPWITNSELGKMCSNNLPKKTNFQNRLGVDSLTGKSNFDISEWMLIQYLEWLRGKTGMIATLCKTSVARKILMKIWRESYAVQDSYLYYIDTEKYFNASVSACLLILNLDHQSLSKKCYVYASLTSQTHESVLGSLDNIILANIENYQRVSYLYGSDEFYTWRSGIKHDCSKVMELNKINDKYYNGYKITVDLETNYLYPLLKSSDLANERISNCRKYLLVTQKLLGDNTESIQQNAPKTWDYLQQNYTHFQNRRSSIYKDRPAFSIFGVGDYSFSPWKVAISGFYKKLKFLSVGLINDRPVMFDDTVYFLSCNSREEAEFLSEILNSPLANAFLKSMIFWSDKRPITINILKRLNIQSLARALGREDEYQLYTQNPR